MSVKRKIKKNGSQNRLEPRVGIVGLSDVDQESTDEANQTKEKARNARVLLDLDPAEKILYFAEETKKKRKRDEVQLALSKIQQRVHSTLNDYERADINSDSDNDLADDEESNIDSIEDPARLYEVLRNSRQRSKYLQKLSVLIYGFEKKCQNREQLLSSLYDFFSENQTVNPQKLFDDVEETEFDFNGATSGLQSAMDTAQEAARRLLAIKQEMSKLVAISTTYPDSKKGRKKMENALLKAQDNVNTLSNSLAKVQAELKDSTSHVKKLQDQIEDRNQECLTLRSDANKSRYLEIAKEKMSKELRAAQEEIKILRVQVQDSKRVMTPKSVIDSRSSKNQSMIEDKFAKDLLLEKEKLQSQHEEDLKAANDNFKAEIEKVKTQYENQLRQKDERRLSSQQTHKRKNSNDASGKMLFNDAQHQEAGAQFVTEVSGQTGVALNVRQSIFKKHQSENSKKPPSAVTDFLPEDNLTASDHPPKDLSSSQNQSDSVSPGAQKKLSSKAIKTTPDTHNEAELDASIQQENKKEPSSNSIEQSPKHSESVSSNLHEQRNVSPTHALSTENEDEPITSKFKTHHTETRPSSPQVHLDPSSSDSNLGGSTAFRASSWKPRRFSMFGRTNLAHLNARNTDRDSTNKLVSKEKEGLSLMIMGPGGGGTKKPISDAEKEILRRKDTATKEYLNKLREEYRSRERKLKQDIKDLKIESHLTISSLQEQLVAIQNENNDQLTPLKEEFEEPVLEVKKQATNTTNKRVAVLENEKAELTKALFETQFELKAQQLLIDQLKHTVSEQLDRLHEQDELLLKKSDRDNGTGIFHQSEVKPSKTTANSCSKEKFELGSNRDKKSTDVSTQHSVSSVPEAHVSCVQKQNLPPSDSPQQQSEVPLQQSRPVLRHSSKSLSSSALTAKPNVSSTGQSTLPTESVELAHDHPVMVEWLKTCKGMSMLRDSMINVLCQSGQYRSMADDLLAINMPSINSSQDLCSEVKTARQKMSSFLHQLTLSMTKIVAQAASQSVSSSGDEEQIMETIRKRLSQQDNNKIVEAQKSQERMMELSNQVSSLKEELISLRRSMAHTRTDKKNVTMFTALDMERNKQTLKLAVETNKISTSTYKKVTVAMEEYISVASERFAYLAQRLLDLAHTRKLIKDIQLSYNSSPKALIVLKRLGELQEKKRLQFSVKMDQLGVKRLDIAHTLTSMLQHIEKRTGTFLIKPVFTETKSFGLHHGQTKIFPLSRPLPVRKSSCSSDTSTLHPSLGLVNKLIQSRRKRRHTLGDLGLGDFKQVPARFPPSHASGDIEWSVQNSLPSNQIGDIVDSLEAQFNPTHPRILELDIQRQSYKKASLGHVYPCLHQTPAYATQYPSKPTGRTKMPINLKMEFDSLNHDSARPVSANKYIVNDIMFA